jgi:ATP-binding cassette subfamily A (ABC1) protein 1
MNATGLNLAYMGALTGGYLLLAVSIDVFLSHPNIRLWCSRDPKVVDTPYEEDEDVVAERVRVKQEIASGHVDDAILVSNLRKVYPGGKVAVKGISFGIGAGEIYGAREVV